MLKNPCYAGAFAYGRTASRTVVREARPHTSHGSKIPLDAWQVLLQEHHPGYIS